MREPKRGWTCFVSAGCVIDGTCATAKKKLPVALADAAEEPRACGGPLADGRPTDLKASSERFSLDSGSQRTEKGVQDDSPTINNAPPSPPKEPTMNTLNRTVRLVSATAAVATTLTLFSAVVSNSEPQRSVLFAKTQRLDKQQSAATVVAVASTENSKARK